MKIHIVKTARNFFEEAWAGRKTFEIRRDDRNYEMGDVLIQRELADVGSIFTGRTLIQRIGYKTGYEQRPTMAVFAVDEIARWAGGEMHEVTES